ncbi:multidrug transporter [Vibrio panuliri]|uniref:Multidrug transporter n=1 Tax=Vibrio panuliri TaxID=1381081 RepID=A0A1Q9HQJ5_9VIBR|nr:HlyD family secretion protein [Vibrio panuliri]OLQ93147.1 multidrug transporter [Vibrio panuliri]
MTEKFYQYALYSVLSITILFSLFLVAADNIAPFTTQASLHRTVATIAPETSGVIETVAVRNGEQVKSGETLFTLDAQSYQLKVSQAKAELAQALQTFDASQQQLNVAKQTLLQKQEEEHNAVAKLVRNKALYKKGLTTTQAIEDSELSVKVAKSALMAAKADIMRIEASLADSNSNAAIQLAKAKLASAELDQQHTQIVAQTDGVVTNLQLQSGSYISQGTTALLLVNESHAWLSADFNEKGIEHLTQDNQAYIAFDAIPGKVFIGHIESQERAIRDIDNSNGQLVDVINDNRWIREQQKIRVRIVLDDVKPEMAQRLISGARASVSVKNGSTLIDAISYTWIHLVSLFRYIY